MAKPPLGRNIQLDYSFDRLLATKLTQVYEILVPDKTWLIGDSDQPTNSQQEMLISVQNLPGFWGKQG